MKNKFQYTILVTILISGLLGGCKKAIDIGAPTTMLATTNVYTKDATARAAVAGIFSKMATVNNMYNGGSGISISLGLAADELVSYRTTPPDFYLNQLTSINTYYFWPEIYSEIFYCNTAIDGLTHATSLTPALQQQLLGEVKFARAFIYFNAVNLYGDVPLALTTDPDINNRLPRAPEATVLAQVIKDLSEAQSLLPDNKYLSLTGLTTTERTLPNKQAASALLARVYLYMKEWQNAEIQASAVLSSSLYLLEPTLTSVFLIPSKETIWQLQSVSTTTANGDAGSLIVTAAPTGTSGASPLRNSLVSAFEANDKRFNSWVGKFVSGATTYYYANKYRQNTVTGGVINEYPIMFRLAEQYLIRAEARAQQNNLSGAKTDLDAVRTRAGLTGNTASTQSQLLTDIYHERQVELFTEFGHRWFDLKRTGRLDAVMNTVTPQKGGTWASYKALLPLPQSELLINPNLSQNPGY